MSHSLKLGLTVATLAALGLSAANPAAAQSTIYNFQVGVFDFGTTYTGNGVLGNGNHTSSTFNREINQGGGVFQVGGGQGFVADSNNSSAIPALTFVYNGASRFAPGGAPLASDPGDLLQVFAVTNSVSDISLTGLTANTAYTAVFYAENGKYADGRKTTFNLTDSTFTPLGGASNTAIATANSVTAFTTNPGNYVTFNGTTDAKGGIFATYATTAGNIGAEGDFNGVQFQVGNPVPEAMSSISLGILLGLGGITLFVRKRIATSRNAA